MPSQKNQKIAQEINNNKHLASEKEHKKKADDIAACNKKTNKFPTNQLFPNAPQQFQSLPHKTKKETEHWDKLVKNYIKTHPKEVKLNANLTITLILIFSTIDAAIAFFTKQAKQNYMFLSQRVNAGTDLDEYCFSCGNGKLYNGCLSEIYESLKTELKNLEQSIVSENEKNLLSHGLERLLTIDPGKTSLREKLHNLKTENVLHPRHIKTPK